MASNLIRIRLRLPNDDPAPNLQASAASPGSSDRYTYHHIIPWRYCLATGDLLLKLGVYGESVSARPRFGAAGGGVAALGEETVGSLFDQNGEQMRARLVKAASGLIQAGTDLHRRRDDDDNLTQFLNRSAAGGETTRLDNWLGWHAGNVVKDDLARFSRPPFAGFWGMLPGQRSDDPRSAPEKLLPASMSEQKQARLRALTVAVFSVFEGTPPLSGPTLVSTTVDAVRTLLLALEPLLGRDNVVHPFDPSDWIYRFRGDMTGLEPWWFCEWEDLHRMQPHNRFPSEQCRLRSFALRRAGEAAAGRRMAAPPVGPVPHPLVWNEAEIYGRARFCVTSR